MSYSVRLTGSSRIAQCEEPGCFWVYIVPRKNGAWMRIKKQYRLHFEAKHQKPEQKK